MNTLHRLSFDTDIDFSDDGDDPILLHVTATISPIIRAVVNRDPYYCHPEEGGELEIEEAIDEHGKDWTEEINKDPILLERVTEDAKRAAIEDEY